MLPERVIDQHIAGQAPLARLGARVSNGLSPLLAQDLNEPLRFAVGAGRVGPGADVPQP